MLITKTEQDPDAEIFRKTTIFQEELVKGKKALRAQELYDKKLEVSGLSFDVDEESLDRMTRVVAAANYKFNLAIASGMTPSNAYSAVFGMEIPWKTADNVLNTITIGVLAEVHYEALLNLSQIWVKYG